MMDVNHNLPVQFIQVTPRSQAKKQNTRSKHERSHGSLNVFSEQKHRESSRLKATQRRKVAETSVNCNGYSITTPEEAESSHDTLDEIEDDLEAINLTSEYDLNSVRQQKEGFEGRIQRISTKEAFTNATRARSPSVTRLSSDESVEARVADSKHIEIGQTVDDMNGSSSAEVEDMDNVSSCSSKAPSLKEAWYAPSSKRKTSNRNNGTPKDAVNYLIDQSETEESCGDTMGFQEDILDFFSNGRRFQSEMDAWDVRPQLDMFYKEVGGGQSTEEFINYNAVTDHTEEFVHMPPPVRNEICCKITRDRKGVDRGLYPTYYLHLERPGGKKILLLAGRKRKKSTTSNYLISTDVSDLSRDSKCCVGKVRSNLLGTQFTIYGNGPSIRKCDKKKLGPVVLREELAAVVYEPNVLGFKGPRKMKVIIPEMKNEVQRHEHRPDKEGDGMLELLKKSECSDFFELKNKSPVWNEDNQSFVLNFHGRVTQASVKNFQIIHEDREDYVILQFGKTASETFTMDYRYPLNALQAFAIVLTSFDNKLACE